MQAVINHLIQLQELILIRDEQKVTSGNEHLESLNASIQSMTQKLPADVRIQFDKLAKRDRLVIVSIPDGICAGCGMRLPISGVQSVRQLREVQYCPNCARILYYSDEQPRRVKKGPRRTDVPKMGIARFSSETLVISDLQAETGEGAIRELAAKMQAEGFVDDAEKFVEGVLRREAILSTVMSSGVAFPHVRGVEGGGLTLALGISRKGVQFHNHGEASTKIIFLVAIPTAASAFYLRLLAGLAQVFSKPEARKLLAAEKEPVKVWKALVKLTRATIK
jgi:mannitol/fructose-specific phosphotransferase system IIA component (Ntr-type)